MLNILNETIEYYSSDVTRRAVDPQSGHCEYLTKDGRMCAVGRMMKKGRWQGCDESIYGTLGDYGKDCLKARFRDLPADFLSDLQGLHDKYRHWDANGLTADGEHQVEVIKNYINIEGYSV